MQVIKNYFLEFKGVFKNFSYTLIYQILALILPIITVPYITRTLDQELVGMNSIIQANCLYFELIGTLGISLLGPREIAKSVDDKQKLSFTFFSIYRIQFIMHLIALVAYCIYVTVFVRKVLGYFYLIYLIAYMFDISWLFIGLEDFKSITVKNVFIRLVSFILLFYFVKKDSDIYKYVVTLYAPQIIINAYMWWLALKKHVVYQRNVFINHYYMREAVSLFIPQVASSIYTVLDKTVLGIFSTYAVAAVYTQAQTLLRLTYAIVPSFCKVLAPRISSCIKRKSENEVYKYMRMSCHVISAISFLIFFGVLACAKRFVTWYLPVGYEQTSSVLILCAPIILMVSGANFISIEYLIPLGEQNKYTISVIISAVLNVILNLLLTPYLGVYGVCIGSVAAETIGFIVQMYYVKEYIDLKKLFSGIYAYCIAGFIMYIILRIVNRHISVTVLGLITMILIGMCSYVFAIMLIRKFSHPALPPE